MEGLLSCMGNDASTPTVGKEGGEGILYDEPDEMSPSSDRPVVASFDSEHLTIGAGVAIFHLASSRVVVCYHPVHKYWFLPKGRRDVNEETGVAAEREGFEEVRHSFSPRLFSCSSLNVKVSSLATVTAFFLPSSVTVSQGPTIPRTLGRHSSASSRSGCNWCLFRILRNMCFFGILPRPLALI